MNNEKIKLKSLVITEDQRRFTKIIDGDSKFTIEIPLPYQKANIISSIARTTGGASIDSIGYDQYEYIRMLITLSVVIVESPEWWEGPDKCPDEEINIELWRFYLDSEKEFQTRLKSFRRTKTLEKSE